MHWLRAAALLITLHAIPAHAFEPFVIKDIRVEGIQRTEAGTIFSYLPAKVGDTMTDERAAQAIRTLFATGFFRDVSLEREGDVLVVVVQERPWTCRDHNDWVQRQNNWQRTQQINARDSEVSAREREVAERERDVEIREREAKMREDEARRREAEAKAASQRAGLEHHQMRPAPDISAGRLARVELHAGL